jgi:hypothetical protein
MPAGDRRQLVRFEITGELWASCGLSKGAVLRNSGAGGVCVEIPVAVPSNGSSIFELVPNQRVQVSFGDRGPAVNVVVRHLSALEGGTDRERQFVGLEFLNVSESDRDSLEELLREQNSGSTHHEKGFRVDRHRQSEERRKEASNESGPP